jgi:hypothetical protein
LACVNAGLGDSLPDIRSGFNAVAMPDQRKTDGSIVYEPVATRDVDASLSVTILEGSNPKRTVSVPVSMTVQQFKQFAFPEHNASKNIRIIHCGKLLSDDQQILADCGLQKSPFLHVAISNKIISPAPSREPEGTTVDMDESQGSLIAGWPCY